MKPLKHYLEHTLCWVQPKALIRSYRLCADDEDETVVASLRFESAFGSLATGQTTRGLWSFKRVGFFKPAVTVRVKGTEENLATYRPRWTGMEGEITFTDGRRIVFKTANFWATCFELQDEAGRPLVEYRAGCGETRFSDVFRYQSAVTVTRAGRTFANLDLLIVTGWYLMVLSREDSAAVVTATTAGALAP